MPSLGMNRLPTPCAVKFECKNMRDHQADIPDTVSQDDPRVDSTDFIVPAEHPEPSADQVPELPAFPGFVVESVIARGGMGVVYLAVDLQLNRKVAIKTVPFDISFTQSRKNRFNREVASLAELHHPNVVQLYRIGDNGGRPFMVLEYVRGTNLGQILRTGPLPFRSAAIITEKIASAIVSAHSYSILHRDLTPGNVLVGVVSPDLIENSIAETQGSLCDHIHEADFDFSEIELKVSDFGLAQMEFGGDQLTKTGGVLGTPGYLAPEAVDSRFGKVTQQTDIYGLGAVLYAMLTGRAPFVASNINESFAQVTKAEVLPPTVLRPNVCPDLQTICLKCLEKQPKDRYETASDLLDDLRRYLGGEQIVARPPSAWRRGNNWARKNQNAIWMAVTIAVIGFTISIAIAYQNYDHAQQQSQTESAMRSDQRLDMIESRFVSDIQILKTLAAFLECQEDIERESFEHFCETAILNHNSLVTLEWVPRVALRDRSKHELSGREEYGKDYSIRWQSDRQQMTRAGTRDEYFPVLYAVPLAQNEQAIGFDVSHEAVRAEAIARAIQIRDVALTRRIQLVQDNQSSSALAFMPVFALDKNTEGETVATSELRGFAVGVIRIEKIIQPFVAMTRANEGVVIRDVSTDDQIIFKSENVDLLSKEPVNQAFRDFEIGTRRWNLELISTASLSRRAVNDLAGHLLTIGILITILLAGLPVIFRLYRARTDLNANP